MNADTIQISFHIHFVSAPCWSTENSTVFLSEVSNQTDGDDKLHNLLVIKTIWLEKHAKLIRWYYTAGFRLQPCFTLCAC